MQNLDDEDRKAVLGEVLMDELKIIREYLEDIPVIKQDVKQLKQDIDELKSDMKAVKVIAKDHSKHLGSHEIRLTRLETTA